MEQLSRVRCRPASTAKRSPSHPFRTPHLPAAATSPPSTSHTSPPCSPTSSCSHLHQKHRVHRLTLAPAISAPSLSSWPTFSSSCWPSTVGSSPGAVHRPARRSLVTIAAASSSYSSSSSISLSAAMSTAAPASDPDSGPASSGERTFEFVCPICLHTRFSLAAMPTQSSGLCCERCGRTFPTSPAYLDLTLTGGVTQKVYNQRAWGGTELFRNPLVSFVYERGWRQSFAWAGFPGVDAEYDLALRYLLPAGGGRVLVDMSCGSGLFARRFARSGSYSGVIAADFSESMLEQTREYCQAEGGSLNGSTPIVLLRADVGRLPLPTGSVAALHAGAAIHCWPNPQAALAEISRVLAPGGVFVASTFLTATAPLGQVLGDETVRPLGQLDPTLPGGLAAAPYRWWEEQELRDLCDSVGLQDFKRERSWRFIMFAVTKPGAASGAAAPM